MYSSSNSSRPYIVTVEKWGSAAEGKRCVVVPMYAERVPARAPARNTYWRDSDRKYRPRPLGVQHGGHYRLLFTLIKTAAAPFFTFFSTTHPAHQFVARIFPAHYFIAIIGLLVILNVFIVFALHRRLIRNRLCRSREIQPDTPTTIIFSNKYNNNRNDTEGVATLYGHGPRNRGTRGLGRRRHSHRRRLRRGVRRNNQTLIYTTTLRYPFRRGRFIYFFFFHFLSFFPFPPIVFPTYGRLALGLFIGAAAAARRFPVGVTDNAYYLY